MLKALTRSRSADFHRATMFRLLIAALLLYWLWEPMRPIRHVTGEALSITAEFIRR